MKKLLATIFMILTIAVQAYAADVVTETCAIDNLNHVRTVTISWSDDTGNGVSDALGAYPTCYRGWIISAETDPGTTAPTDNYDIELITTTGGDVMEGALYNRDTSNSERTVFSNPVYINGAPTFTVIDASQDANSGVTTANKLILHIYYEK